MSTSELVAHLCVSSLVFLLEGANIPCQVPTLFSDIGGFSIDNALTLYGKELYTSGLSSTHLRQYGSHIHLCIMLVWVLFSQAMYGHKSLNKFRMILQGTRVS